jgi:UDP-glucose 4-epimerase
MQNPRSERQSSRLFHDKCILITGGTGSFGNEVVRSLLAGACREVRILSRDELKQEVMRRTLNDSRLRFHIGDVRDIRTVDRAMRGVDIVFHAAALKQVPSCEFFPDQALLTNVNGSQNVLDAAIEQRVSVVACLSTDKAVYPVNAMGMTKALMEKTVQAKARTLDAQGGPVLTCVRYGNVLYTRGSVVPIFVEQILADKPITITDPQMTRYLLTLNEAIGLVEFSLVNARQGDLFIRKSPACTLQTLADALKQLFRSDVPVSAMGVRHGEKIHETLATFQEFARAEDMGDFLRVPMDDRDLNYESYTAGGQLERASAEDYTSANTRQLDVEETAAVLEQVPEIQRALRLKLRQ